MAKKKTNPYGEFVKAEYIEMKKNPNFNKPMCVMFSDPIIKEKWENCDQETKQKYRDIANSKNGGTHTPQSFHMNNKNTTQHVPNKPSDETQHESMAGDKLFDPCKDIIYSKDSEKLLRQPLFSFSCNVMCADNETDDQFIPLEIAIFAYGMEDRVPIDKPPYLTYVNPGPPPVGRMNEAKQHYEEAGHKIPFEPIAPFLECARTDYRAIYQEILEYVGEERIILCQQGDYIQQIHGVLKWLAKKANEKPEKRATGLIRSRYDQMPYLPGADSWRIYGIAEYVFNMGKRLGSPLPDSVCVDMLLENMKFTYSDQINCDWHSLPENETQWCAQSCAIRTILNLEELFDWFKQTNCR